MNGPEMNGPEMSGPEMSGPAHYRMSERILTEVAQTDALEQVGEDAEYCRQQLAAAQVHATLALAAATAYPAVRDHLGSSYGTPGEWAGVAS